MKEFTFFIQNGSVKKQAPDLNTAKATAKDCLERLQLAKNILTTQKPKYCLENSYEAIRELIDAVLFLEGYKSFSQDATRNEAEEALLLAQKTIQELLKKKPELNHSL